jgi:hypothetical protein
MGKLRLQMEELSVESFETVAQRDTRRGTVRAHASWGEETCRPILCPGGDPTDYQTCPNTCANTCAYTCDDVTCATCANTCQATCEYTCDDATCATCRTDCFGPCGGTTGGGGTTIP